MLLNEALQTVNVADTSPVAGQPNLLQALQLHMCGTCLLKQADTQCMYNGC